MPLTKYKIDKEVAANQYYLVGGNRIHLAEVDGDLVAEKLFKAGIAGVSQVEAAPASPVAEAEPAVLPEAEAPVVKKK